MRSLRSTPKHSANNMSNFMDNRPPTNALRADVRALRVLVEWIGMCVRGHMLCTNMYTYKHTIHIFIFLLAPGRR